MAHTHDGGVHGYNRGQGAFGYLSKSPVTVASNLDFEFFDEMREDENVKMRNASEEKPWVMAVRRNIATKLMETGVASTRAWAEQRVPPDIRKMTAEQGWRLHVERDHVPYRKDCEQCVMSLGTGPPSPADEAEERLCAECGRWRALASCFPGCARLWLPVLLSGGLHEAEV